MSASTEPTRATRHNYELLVLTPFGLVPVPYYLWAAIRALGGTTAWREL